MRKLGLLFCFMSFAGAFPAKAQSSTVADLLVVYGKLNGMCRGWVTNEPEHRGEVCAVREKVGLALDRLNFCYGKRGQSGNQMKWHKCNKESERPAY